LRERDQNECLFLLVAAREEEKSESSIISLAEGQRKERRASTLSHLCLSLCPLSANSSTMDAAKLLDQLKVRLLYASVALEREDLESATSVKRERSN